MKNKILVDTVLDLFADKGPSFKMDDVARALKISKKTIYKEYGNKEALIIQVVQSVFDSIAQQLQRVLDDPTYSTVDKLIHASCSFPDPQDIDYHKALLLKDAFPQAYAMFLDHIENNWQINQMLYNQAVAEGAIRDIGHDMYRTMTMGITKQVLSMPGDNQADTLMTCLEHLFTGIRIPSTPSTT